VLAAGKGRVLPVLAMLAAQGRLRVAGSEGPSLRKRTVRNENMGEILPISGEKG